MSKTLAALAGLDATMRIVVLHGKEPFLIGEGTARLADALRAAFGSIAKFSLEGETAELAAVLDELRSFALFEPHKLVVVDNADKFVSGDQRRRALEAYAQNPTEQATLLLRSEGWRPGKFDKLVAKVSRARRTGSGTEQS